MVRRLSAWPPLPPRAHLRRPSEGPPPFPLADPGYRLFARARHAIYHGARALGLGDRGTLAAGRRADLAIWDVREPAELSYRIGFNPLHARVFGGEFV